jgi:hypothetical protein
MTVAAGVGRVLMLSLLFYLGASILEDRYQGSFGPPDEYPHSMGNASNGVRSEILAVLQAFQEGYERRDPEQVAPFMERLFSRHDVLILGTMPQEVVIGFDEATRLVRADWAGWGDCSFAVDTARVSADGDVAWFSTVGYVEFDLSRLLVLPLRLAGTLAKEDGLWRFRQLQFQFDLDLSFLLAIHRLVAVWLAFSVLTLLVSVVRAVRARQASSEATAAGTQPPR